MDLNFFACFSEDEMRMADFIVLCGYVIRVTPGYKIFIAYFVAFVSGFVRSLFQYCLTLSETDLTVDENKKTITRSQWKRAVEHSYNLCTITFCFKRIAFLPLLPINHSPPFYNFMVFLID